VGEAVVLKLFIIELLITAVITWLYKEQAKVKHSLTADVLLWKTVQIFTLIALTFIALSVIYKYHCLATDCSLILFCTVS